VDFAKQFRLLPDSASTVSPRVDAMAWYLTALSAFFTVLIFLLVVWFSLRYRRRSEDEIPPETRSHPWLETMWAAALFVLFMFTFGWGARLYVDVKKPAAHALEINVIGKQWMWKIQHPGGQREINELHVPVGRPIKLIMTSQDVIHSFGLPAFRITQDVLPGAYSTQWFTANRTGEYHLFCREYCGTLHSGMVGRVIVMEPQEYEAWLAGTLPNESPVVAGARLFASYGCAQCHGQLAPTLAGLYGRQVRLEDGSVVTADEQYIRESILNPPAKVVAGFSRLMPSYRGQLSEEQVADLVAYVKSLGSAAQPGVTGAAAANVRTDVAAPASRPVNAVSPESVPNRPPAGEPPPQLSVPPAPSGGRP
jgi:cytochrome c oxidase subunit 2